MFGALPLEMVSDTFASKRRRDLRKKVAYFTSEGLRIWYQVALSILTGSSFESSRWEEANVFMVHAEYATFSTDQVSLISRRTGSVRFERNRIALDSSTVMALPETRFALLYSAMRVVTMAVRLFREPPAVSSRAWILKPWQVALSYGCAVEIRSPGTCQCAVGSN